MNRIKEFESIIRSSLSDEEVVEKIMSILSNEKTDSYYNIKKMGYHCGFINNDSHIPMLGGIFGDINIILDESFIYYDAIKEVRKKLNNGEKYESATITIIKLLVSNYFSIQQSNSVAYNKFKNYLDYYKNRYQETKNPYYQDYLDLAKIRYICNEAIKEDCFTMIYPIHFSQGLGDGAMCTERNTLSNNLLNFFGFLSTNINSEININDEISLHNYNIIKLTENQNYMIFDEALKIYLLEIPSDCNLDTGFTVQTRGNNITYITPEFQKYKIRKKKYI